MKSSAALRGEYVLTWPGVAIEFSIRARTLQPVGAAWIGLAWVGAIAGAWLSEAVAIAAVAEFPRPWREVLVLAPAGGIVGLDWSRLLGNT
jgi:hypothetical protein